MNNEQINNRLRELEEKIQALECAKSGRMKKFFGKAFRPMNMIIGISVSALMTALVVYAAQITFTDGTVISAADVNTNFNELYASKWSRNGSNYFVNDGRVGIGTSSPEVELEVNGLAKGSNGFFMGGVNSNTRIEYGIIDVKEEKDYSVSFSKEFSSTPIIVFGAAREYFKECFATMPFSPSKTGFTVRLVQYDGDWSIGKIYWMAIGN